MRHRYQQLHLRHYLMKCQGLQDMRHQSHLLHLHHYRVDLENSHYHQRFLLKRSQDSYPSDFLFHLCRCPIVLVHIHQH